MIAGYSFRCLSVLDKWHLPPLAPFEQKDGYRTVYSSLEAGVFQRKTLQIHAPLTIRSFEHIYFCSV